MMVLFNDKDDERQGYLPGWLAPALAGALAMALASRMRCKACTPATGGPGEQRASELRQTALCPAEQLPLVTT